MTIRGYATAQAWKQALEERLRTASGAGPQFARLRQTLVYHRFLARVMAAFGSAVTIKGGVVLELRTARARATKDVDLSMTGRPGEVLASLRAAAVLDLGDAMQFDVRPDEVHPEIRITGMPWDGLRFRVACSLAGKLYGRPFGVDVAFDETEGGTPDILVAEDLLAFAGVAPPTLRVCAVETHIAEKVHAYTVPRSRPNSRVKDLPDLALLATVGPLDGKRLRAALERAHERRGTHALPGRLPEPPTTWAGPYLDMARENELAWPTLADVTRAVRAFLDPALAGPLDAQWQPSAWTWIGS